MMTASAGFEISTGQDSMLFKSCKKEVHIEIPKRVKTPSFRRWLFAPKGRRKNQDNAITPPEENKLYLEDDYTRTSINLVASTEIDKLVQLPRGMDEEEWVSSHTISFFEHINLMYGTLSEYCQPTGCSSMSAPGNTQYSWLDEKNKKCKCAATQYVEYVMTYTQKTIHDESVFPTKYGNVFPSSFMATVRKIMRLLFHVLAHIYHAHYRDMVNLSLHEHLNLLFEHFMTFSRRFSLLEDKEAEVLDDLYEKLKKARVRQQLELEDAKAATLGEGPTVAQPTSCAMETQQDCDENKENLGAGEGQTRQAPAPQPVTS